MMLLYTLLTGVNWLNNCMGGALKGAENGGDPLRGEDLNLQCSGWHMGS